jgi:hypothetical protein
MRGQLDARLERLEARAAKVMLREVCTRLAIEAGLDPNEVFEEACLVKTRMDRLRAAGLGEQEIRERLEREAGADPGELRREQESLAGWFGW